MLWRISISSYCAVSMMCSLANSEDLPQIGQRLNESQVRQFANLALGGMDTPYPNKPSHVLVDEGSLRSPREFHPAFYGCFDWHSSVHGHWMLVRLLKSYPDSESAGKIRAKLNDHLSAENLQAEADYFNEKQNKSFERMYGWAWLLRLAAELHSWDDEQGSVWRKNIEPLEQQIVDLTMGYLPRLSYPIRTGVHPDTAFALGQTLDYARIVGNVQLEEMIVQRSKAFYMEDVDYPSRYEPSGEDFFSASLNEADLMRRILTQKEFAAWLDRFLPTLQDSENNLLAPVEVSDVTDGKLVHLAGLDFCRAWTLDGIANALPEDDPRRPVLLQSAAAHVQVGLGYVFSGHYEGEHWLATFAIYAIDRVGSQGIAPE